MSDFKWLEEFHISKYTKKYDARVEGRFLSAPKLTHRFEVGETVRIVPVPKYKVTFDRRNRGKHAKIIEIQPEDHPMAGRFCNLEFFDGSGTLLVKEINLRPLTKSE